jgi:hypothetical protein
LLAKHELEA